MKLADLRFGFTARSGNRKTGRIAVTISSFRACPLTCSFYGICYAAAGRLRLHWQAITAGKRTMRTQAKPQKLADHCRSLRALPAGSMVRFNSAGDLPGNGKRLFVQACRKLLRAVEHCTAFTYTHYTATSAQLQTVAGLNAAFSTTVNLSADSISDLERLRSTGSPIVVVANLTEKRHVTARGTVIVRCPAEYSNVQCGNPKPGFRACGNGRPLCAQKTRTYAIGFNAHGQLAGKVTAAMLRDAERKGKR